MRSLLRRIRNATLLEEGWHAFQKGDKRTDTWAKTFGVQAAECVLENHVRRYVFLGSERPKVDMESQKMIQQMLEGELSIRKKKKATFRVKLGVKKDPLTKHITGITQKVKCLDKRGNPAVLYANAMRKGKRGDDVKSLNYWMNEKWPTLPEEEHIFTSRGSIMST